jgi:hypothetical protein
MLLLVVPLEEGVDELGMQFISVLKSQGQPSMMGILVVCENGHLFILILTVYSGMQQSPS